MTLTFVLPDLTFVEALGWPSPPRAGDVVALFSPPAGYRTWRVETVTWLQALAERSCPEVYFVPVPGVTVRCTLVPHPPTPAVLETPDGEPVFYPWGRP